MRCQAGQLIALEEAHVEGSAAPADDLSWLVWPGGQYSGFCAVRDLLDPAEQGNVGALGIAPPVMSRSQCRSGADIRRSRKISRLPAST